MPDKSKTNKIKHGGSVSAVGAKVTKRTIGENDFDQGQASTKFTSKRQFGGKVKRE
ncbi:hypothetical protein HZC31_04475 [Candidatus Woesearchaeota archaeon]|nr:hypothetical protein [Candidatus Woesearchaeota archaeon]